MKTQLAQHLQIVYIQLTLTLNIIIDTDYCYINSKRMSIKYECIGMHAHIFPSCNINTALCICASHSVVSNSETPIACQAPHGILQARILEWAAIPFSRGPSRPRYRTQISCIAGRFFTIRATREANIALCQKQLTSQCCMGTIREMLMLRSVWPP